MTINELFFKNKFAIVQIVIADSKDVKLTSGSAFFAKDHLISNNHVFFDENNIPLSNTTVYINYLGKSGLKQLKFSYEEFMQEIFAGSDVNNKDYIIFKDRLLSAIKTDQCELSNKLDYDVGTEVVLLGFPFGRKFLTSHHGYISAIYDDGGVSRIQIDASVNPGNSGGPLIDIKTGQTIGIVTRSITGLTENFDKLISSFDANITALNNIKGMMSMGSIDPIQAIIVSQAQMKIVARNLKKTANVGIGIAYSIKEVINELEKPNQEKN